MDREEEKNKKENDKVKEPMATYYTKSMLLDREIPDYIWEDVRIGLEEYNRGECKPVSEFLAKYGR